MFKLQEGKVGRGGTYILMESKLVKFVLEYKVLATKKMQLFRLKGLPCGDLGIINVYAPKNLTNKIKGMFGRQLKRRCQGIVFGCFAVT
jgi:hypothetical protein